MQRSSNPENKDEYGAVAQDLLRAISHRVLGTLIQHINLVAQFLTRRLPTYSISAVGVVVMALYRRRPGICVAYCCSVHVARYTPGAIFRGTDPIQQSDNFFPAG